jgi:transposase
MHDGRPLHGALMQELHRAGAAGATSLRGVWGYHGDRRLLRARGITPVIARRGVAHGSGLGKQREVVERGFAHLHNFRRLPIRYERLPEIHTALLVLACSILCWRRLKSL